MRRKIDITSGIVSLIIGLIFMIQGGSDFFALSGDKEVQDLMTLTSETCKKGKYVKGEVIACYGCFCEEVTTRNGVPMRTDRYYLIPYGEDGSLIIGVKVASNQFDAYENLCDQTYEVLEGTRDKIDAYVLPIQGKIKKCNFKMKGYLEDFFEDPNYEDYCMPYYIEEASAFSGKILFVFGIIFFIFGGSITGFFVAKRVKYVNELKQQAIVQATFENSKVLKYDEGDENEQRF